MKSSRCATGQERGCPVAQPGNMWLSRYATGQHKAAPLSNRTRSKPSRCATGVQLRLFCCLTSTAKLSCTVSQCHLQETRHLGISLHEGVQFSLAAEVNHAPGSYVYTMGVLYGEISTWPTKQLVDLSRRYVSTKRVRRLLTEQLVEVTLF